MGRARIFLLLIGLLSVGLATGCRRSGPDVTTEPPVADSAEPVTGSAQVDQLELLFAESFPVQISAVVRGNLPDGCTTLDPVETVRQDNTFRLTLTTTRPADAVCTEALVPFEQVVELPARGLPAGSYLVDANGVQQAFVLDVDNEIAPDPTATPEPTATPAPTDAVIRGIVWHDVCGIAGGEGGSPPQPTAGCVTAPDGSSSANGILEDNEEGLADVTVTLRTEACPGTAVLAELTTDALGQFTFDAVPPGTYCVGVDATADGNAALLIPGGWTAPADAVDSGGTTVTVAAGDVAAVALGWDFQFLPVPDIVNDPNCIDVASFVTDVTIPDDTPVEAGATFVKTWRFINTGGCIWLPDYELAFVDGEQMGAEDAVALNTVVAPGQTVDVSVTLTAPETEGTYRGDWQVRNSADTLLGLDGDLSETAWVQIEVVPAGSLASVTGVVWDDACNAAVYSGVGDLPPGCVRNDNGTLRGNSILEPDESRLDDVIVTLGSGECGDADPLTTTVTGADGSFSFANLRPGTYCVYIEVLIAGNIDRLVPGAFTFPAPNRSGQTVVLAAGDALDNINFGWDFSEGG